MRLGIMFWNVANREVSREIAEIIDHCKVDFLAVCEANSFPNEISSNPLKRRFIEIAPVVGGPDRKVRLFASDIIWKQSSVVMEDPSGRMVITRIILDKSDILVAAVHLPSKVNFSAEDQAATSRETAKQLRDTEELFGHRRSVLIGDFNMNPFEYGLIHANGFHAVMDKSIAQRGSRTVQAMNFPFFYNPMWGCFGDRTPGPSGTHYYSSGVPGLFFWNIFDQVMIRPELLSNFDDEVAIIDRIGDSKLFNREGRPSASDHFPVQLGLNFS